MADDQFNEDAALRYVLGELTGAEQREFESRLAASAELRALVSELETGLVAAAIASPRRRPPAGVWQRIEKAVVKKSSSKPGLAVFRLGWWRNGWAVAVICLAGWLFYAFLTNQHYTAAMAKLEIQRPEIAIASPPEPPPQPVVIKSFAPAATNIAVQLLQARTREIMELRGKIAQLETAKTQLSRSVAWQHALLSESNRIKFYDLFPAATAGANAGTAPLSPGLQRAVSMALARELGWLPADSQSAPQADGNAPRIPVNIGGVDFIDFRPGSHNVVSQPPAQPQDESGQSAADNKAAAPPVQPQTQPQAESPAASQGTPASDPAIPAFVSGDNLVVALDSTVVPFGSSVSLGVLGANQNQTIGTFILGSNPAVITFPLAYFSDPSTPLYTAASFGTGGFLINISSLSPNGQSSTLQFYAPPTTTP